MSVPPAGSSNNFIVLLYFTAVLSDRWALSVSVLRASMGTEHSVKAKHSISKNSVSDLRRLCDFLFFRLQQEMPAQLTTAAAVLTLSVRGRSLDDETASVTAASPAMDSSVSVSFLPHP